MTLETYITDLLYRYDCVIVPNFGGFVANSKSAQIKTNSFLPPFKQLTFNSLLQNNDGLLANYIASVDKMPYETAVNYINFEVQSWIDKLLDEELDLKGLGTLLVNNEKIQFEPENKVNYLTSSYGLGQFVSNDIRREELVLANEESNVIAINTLPSLENKRETYKEQVVALEENNPIYISEEKRRKTPNYLKYAAIFILGASVIGIGNKTYQDRQQQITISNFEKQQQLHDAKIQKATFIIDAPLPTINLKTVVKKDVYFIIAGAFRDELNATKKVNELIEKGFKAKTVGKNKWNLTQVAFSSFNNLDKANTELAIIKKYTAKDAWLLINE